MKHILSLAATVIVVALTFVGCGDDGPSEPVNTYLVFKVGDQFTYSFYQRDSTNQRVDASKQVRKWSVLRTDITVNGRSTATEVEEQVFDATGTTLAYRDTLYFSSTGQGKVEQYDIIGNLLALIPFAATYRDSVSPTWVQIGDVKTSGALTWVSLPQIQVNNIDIPGTSFKAVITLSMNASHKGRIALTTTAGSFTNNFKTDHSLKFVISSLGVPVVTDSIQAHYNIDTKGGITRNDVDSRTFTVPGIADPVNIPGYEMELVSYTRAQ